MGGEEPIHYRHVDVHYDDFNVDRAASLFLAIDEDLDSFFTVVCLDTVQVKLLAKHNFEWYELKLVVVYNQDCLVALTERVGPVLLNELAVSHEFSLQFVYLLL